MNIVALIVAGGSSTRFGGEMPKQYCSLLGKPLLAWTLARFEEAETIDHIVVVASEEYIPYVSEDVVDRYQISKVSKVVSGGASRQDSVRLGLQSISSSCSIVAIHDAARPLISPMEIDALIRTHIRTGSKATIIASKVTDTIKEVVDGRIIRTVDRSGLVQAETPQVFSYKTICKLHAEAEQADGNNSYTDDAQLAEEASLHVQVVPSQGNNMKITTANDMKIVESVLQG